MPSFTMKGSICMKWFRANTRHGSRLALFALLIQFALSFGHCHPLAAQAAIRTGLTHADLVQSGTSAARDAANGAVHKQLPFSPDSDQPPADGCAICAVMALASNVLLAKPPALPLSQAVEHVYLTTDAGFAHRTSAHHGFQSRAPPLS
jgi:Protein of unknown function (DUF2946)